MRERPAIWWAMIAGLMTLLMGCARSEPSDQTHDLTVQFENALLDGDVNLATKLLGKGADPNGTGSRESAPILLAIGANDVGLVTQMIAQGTSLDVTDPYTLGKPLYVAASLGLPECARLLLDAGTSVSERNQRNWTPLMAACALGNAETVRVLLDAGADPTIGLTSTRLTPLSLAQGHADREEATLIVDALTRAIAARDPG